MSKHYLYIKKRPNSLHTLSDPQRQQHEMLLRNVESLPDVLLGGSYELNRLLDAKLCFCNSIT